MCVFSRVVLCLLNQAFYALLDLSNVCALKDSNASNTVPFPFHVMCILVQANGHMAPWVVGRLSMHMHRCMCTHIHSYTHPLSLSLTRSHTRTQHTLAHTPKTCLLACLATQTYKQACWANQPHNHRAKSPPARKSAMAGACTAACMMATTKTQQGLISHFIAAPTFANHCACLWI